MDSFFITLLLSAIAFGIFALVLHFDGAEIVASTFEFCAAGEALMLWRKNNPNLYIGDHHDARALVYRHIEACERHARHHSFLDHSQHILFLYSLLDEHSEPTPPNPRRRRFPYQRSPAGLFFCVKKQQIALLSCKDALGLGEWHDRHDRIAKSGMCRSALHHDALHTLDRVFRVAFSDRKYLTHQLGDVRRKDFECLQIENERNSEL